MALMAIVVLRGILFAWEFTWSSSTDDNSRHFLKHNYHDESKSWIRSCNTSSIIILLSQNIGIIPFSDSFAQWQYHSQWGLSEAWLLLVENYTQYPTLWPWNMGHCRNFYRLPREQVLYSIIVIIYTDVCHNKLFMKWMLDFEKFTCVGYIDCQLVHSWLDKAAAWATAC